MRQTYLRRKAVISGSVVCRMLTAGVVAMVRQRYLCPLISAVHAGPFQALEELMAAVPFLCLWMLLEEFSIDPQIVVPLL